MGTARSRPRTRGCPLSIQRAIRPPHTHVTHGPCVMPTKLQRQSEAQGLIPEDRTHFLVLRLCVPVGQTPQLLRVTQSILSPGQGLRTRAKCTTGKQGLRYTPRPEAPVVGFRAFTFVLVLLKSILSPGQGWYRSAKAQNSTKAPLTGNPNQLPISFTYCDTS
jgi:hypothetical protein